MVREDRGVEREPHQDHRQQPERTREQAAVPNPQIEPGQRAALERPADRDPLLFELERNREGHETEHRRGHQSQPSEIAVLLRLQLHQPDQNHREHDRLKNGQRSDDVIQAAIEHRLVGDEEERNTGQHRRHPRPPIIENPFAEDQWEQHERRPGQNVEEQNLPPRHTVCEFAVHGDKGRENGNSRQEVPPLSGEPPRAR